MARNKRRTNKRGRRRRYGSVFGVYRKSAVIISVILFFFVSALGIHAVSLQAKNKEYERQEAELIEQIEAQKARAEDVEEFRAYAKTEDYEKEIAEEKLGLVDPDEILFKATE